MNAKPEIASHFERLVNLGWSFVFQSAVRAYSALIDASGKGLSEICVPCSYGFIVDG